MSDDIKSCPFCSGPAYMQSPSLGCSGWRVICDDCMASGPSHSSKNPADDDRAIHEATASWNYRIGGL